MGTPKDGTGRDLRYRTSSIYPTDEDRRADEAIVVAMGRDAEDNQWADSRHWGGQVDRVLRPNRYRWGENGRGKGRTGLGRGRVAGDTQGAASGHGGVKFEGFLGPNRYGGGGKENL